MFILTQIFKQTGTSLLVFKFQQTLLRKLVPCKSFVRLSIHHLLWRAHGEGGEQLRVGVDVETRQLRVRLNQHSASFPAPHCENIIASNELS